MARRRNPPESVRAKWQLADRLRTIRTELFGERGLAELARQINVPIRTWYSYETGVTVPAEVLLKFVELTLVEPVWLLHGQGPKYQTPLPDPSHVDAVTPAATQTRLPADRSNQGVLSARIVGPAFERSSSNGAIKSADMNEAHSAGDVSTTNDPHQTSVATRPSLSRQRSCRCVRIEGNAMEPIIADGAFVAFADAEEDLSDLEGKLVVAQLRGRPIVRWFHYSGRFAMMRAENAAFEPGTELIDLDDQSHDLRIRRVLWIGTPH